MTNLEKKYPLIVTYIGWLGLNDAMLERHLKAAEVIDAPEDTYDIDLFDMRAIRIGELYPNETTLRKLFENTLKWNS